METDNYTTGEPIITDTHVSPSTGLIDTENNDTVTDIIDIDISSNVPRNIQENVTIDDILNTSQDFINTSSVEAATATTHVTSKEEESDVVTTPGHVDRIPPPKPPSPFKTYRITSILVCNTCHFRQYNMHAENCQRRL